MHRGKLVLKAMAAILMLATACFMAALGLLTYAERHPGKAREDSAAIIVLGAQVKSNGELSLQLESRMETALREYERMPRRVICCGGQGANEPIPEGEAMRQWLIDHGVPPADVIAETDSDSTEKNLRNAKSLLPEGCERVTVVTSDYHLPRALRLAKDAGLDADGVGSPCKEEYWFKNHSREVLAWGKYFLRKVVPIR